MTILREGMFTTAPFIAMVMTVFIFSTLLTAKKDKTVRSFMELLLAFILWTSGAYFMRMQMAPGVVFWWKVSLTGLFAIPFLYFVMCTNYLEQKGFFLKYLWAAVTIVMEIGNICNWFMTVPKIQVGDGVISSDYTLKIWAIFPVIAACLIIFCIVITVRRAMKTTGINISYMTPLFIGVGVMIVGIGINMIPGMTSYPTDTLAVAINACFIYYALYKKRFYALNQVVSKGAMYVISLLITALVVTQAYTAYWGKLQKLFEETRINAAYVLIIACSAAAILVFLTLTRLNEGLFVRERMRREFEIKEFSNEVSSSLQVQDILVKTQDMICKEIPISHIYLCMYDEPTDTYVTDDSAGIMEYKLSFAASHPMIAKLEQSRNGILYDDFRRMPIYRAVHEQEKRKMEMLNITYVLPFHADGKLICFALLAKKENGKPYTYSEVNYLESVVSVASIALRNAQLYRELEHEAQIDPMTGILNRRYFNKRLEQAIQEGDGTIALVLLNLDDFSLYNELYGTPEGDQMLKTFANLMRQVFPSGTTLARYSGKEFAVILRHTDVFTAQKLTEALRDQLQEHISRERIKKFLTFSAGICAYPQIASNINQLISYANMAVFQVKQRGKNGIRIYNGTDSENGTSRAEGVHELTATIYALTAAIDAKDHYTFNHSRCVSQYAAQLAGYAGLPDDVVEVVRQAGLLHDIGKIGIPDAILSKTGRLTTEEFGIMRQHVERSIEMIRHLPDLDYVIPAVLGHHERVDGKGYPRGISGETIPVTARCLSVADAFDAMISKRSYKDKMRVDDALSEIEKNLGSQFDEQLGALFVELIRSGKIKVIPY